MKQAYLIEIDDEIPLRDHVKRLLEINSGQSDFFAFDYALGEVADVLSDAIPVSQSLAWQAKRDASMEKAK